VLQRIERGPESGARRAWVDLNHRPHPYQLVSGMPEERLMEQTSSANWLLRFMAAHAPKSTVTATLR
jgi:hypothetical protein